jgi:hypothetical protein
MTTTKTKFFQAVAVFVVFGLLALVKAPVVLATTQPGWTILQNAMNLSTEGMLSQSETCGTLSGALYNPAYLGINKLNMLELSSEAGFADDKLTRVLYGHSLFGGEIMLGGAYYDAGSVDLNWIDSNNSLQTQTVALEKDTLGLLSYGRKVCGNVYAGLTLKAASSQIAEAQTANAYGADIGVMARLSKNFMLSAALLNSGTSTKFIDESDPLPQTGSLGIIYNHEVGQNMSFVAGAGTSYDLVDQLYIYTGSAEIRYGRAALNAEYSVQGSQQSVTYGGTIGCKSFIIGLSCTQTSYIDNVQRLTVGVKFGASKDSDK